MDRKEWIAQLKVGDQVILDGRGRKIATVSRFTPTMIVVGELKFNRSSGDQVGGERYYSVSLQKPTPEIIADIRRKGSIVRLQCFNQWDKLPPEAVAEIVAIIKRSLPTPTPEQE